MKTIPKGAKLIMVRTEKFGMIYLRYREIKYLIVQISAEFWRQCLIDKVSFDFIKHQTTWKAKRIAGAWMQSR